MGLNNKPFGNMLSKKKDFHLDIGVTIYIPSTKNKTTPISGVEFNARIDYVDKWLRKMFGGYTTIKGKGGYTTDDGSPVEERVAKVTTYVKKSDYMIKRKKLLSFIRSLKRLYGQESIGYEIEGDMHYIK